MNKHSIEKTKFYGICNYFVKVRVTDCGLAEAVYIACN